VAAQIPDAAIEGLGGDVRLGLVRLVVMKRSSFGARLITAVAVHDVEQGPVVEEPAEVLGEQSPDRLS
jgi:hypothetical protein